MPYKYHESVNIYDKDAIARTVQSMETQFTVVNGKISSLITDTELATLRNGGTTMFNRMYTMEQTVDGLSSTVSSLRTSLENDYPTTVEMQSAITQKANEITLAVSQTLANYSTTQQMNSAIQQSATSITQTVSSTYYTKTDGQTLEGRVSTAESKITDSAIVSTVTSSQGFNNSVSSLIEQSASSIRLQASQISWTSDNSSMTAAGVLTCTGATISGKVTATTGKIGPWNITSTAIYKTSSTWGSSASGAAYFGNNGISITDKFKVSAAGAMTSTSGDIGNWIIDPAKGFRNTDSSVFLSASLVNATVPDEKEQKSVEVQVLARFGSVSITNQDIRARNINANNLSALSLSAFAIVPNSGTLAEQLAALSTSGTISVQENASAISSSYSGRSAAFESRSCDILLKSAGNIRIKDGNDTIYDLINSCWRANKITIENDGSVNLWGPKNHLYFGNNGDLYVTDSVDSTRSFSLLEHTFRRHIVNEGAAYPVKSGRLYVAFFYHPTSVKSSGIFIFVGGSTTAQPILMGSGSGTYNGNIYIELTTTSFTWSDNNNNPTCYLYY